MANLALIEAMSTDEKPTKSKNKDTRDIIKKVKSLVEFFNKSAKMDAEFKDLQARDESMYRERGDDIGCCCLENKSTWLPFRGHLITILSS